MSVMPNLALGEGDANDGPLNRGHVPEESGEVCRCPLCGGATRDLGVRFAERFVLVKGETICLSRSEAVIFGALYRERPNMVHKDRLFAAYLAAKPRYFKRPGEKIIEAYIYILRKKLEKHGVNIENVWGFGYRLSAMAHVYSGPSMAE